MSTWTKGSSDQARQTLGTRNNLKRISGITDIGHLETLGQQSSRDSMISNNDLLRRAQMVGTMSSYSVYQLSEGTVHK